MLEENFFEMMYKLPDSSLDFIINDSMHELLDIDIRNEVANVVGDFNDIFDSNAMPPLDLDSCSNDVDIFINTTKWSNNNDLIADISACVNPTSVMPELVSTVKAPTKMVRTSNSFSDDEYTTIGSSQLSPKSNLKLNTSLQSNMPPLPSPKLKKSHLTFSPNPITIPLNPIGFNNNNNNNINNSTNVISSLKSSKITITSSFTTTTTTTVNTTQPSPHVFSPLFGQSKRNNIELIKRDLSNVSVKDNKFTKQFHTNHIMNINSNPSNTIKLAAGIGGLTYANSPAYTKLKQSINNNNNNNNKNMNKNLVNSQLQNIQNSTNSIQQILPIQQITTERESSPKLSNNNNNNTNNNINNVNTNNANNNLNNNNNNNSSNNCKNNKNNIINNININTSNESEMTNFINLNSGKYNLVNKDQQQYNNYQATNATSKCISTTGNRSSPAPSSPSSISSTSSSISSATSVSSSSSSASAATPSPSTLQSAINTHHQNNLTNNNNNNLSSSPAHFQQQQQQQPQLHQQPLQFLQENQHFTPKNNKPKKIQKSKVHCGPISEYPKPAYSYSCLIALALKNSRAGSLPVSEIYSFMCEHFPYFKTAPNGWKNSVRHNLSLNKCFEKIEKPATNGGQRKGCLWAMNPLKLSKMDEELQKWSRKDVMAIRKAMVFPDNLELLERGEIKHGSLNDSDDGGEGECEEEDTTTTDDSSDGSDVDVDETILSTPPEGDLYDDDGDARQNRKEFDFEKHQFIKNINNNNNNHNNNNGDGDDYKNIEKENKLSISTTMSSSTMSSSAASPIMTTTQAISKRAKLDLNSSTISPTTLTQINNSTINNSSNISNINNNNNNNSNNNMHNMITTNNNNITNKSSQQLHLNNIQQQQQQQQHQQQQHRRKMTMVHRIV